MRLVILNATPMMAAVLCGAVAPPTKGDTPAWAKKTCAGKALIKLLRLRGSQVRTAGNSNPHSLRTGRQELKNAGAASVFTAHNHAGEQVLFGLNEDGTRGFFFATEGLTLSVPDMLGHD